MPDQPNRPPGEEAKIGRPPEGGNRDAEGHQIVGDGKRLYMNPGVYGGQWYRDKQGYVQYGVLAGGQGRFSSPVSPITARKVESSVPSANAANLVHQDLRPTFAYAQAYGFGSQMQRALLDKLSPEVLHDIMAGNVPGLANGSAELPEVDPKDLTPGSFTLSALMASEMGLPIESLIQDVPHLINTAQRLGLPPEEVLTKAFEAAYVDPATGAPLPNAKQYAAQHVSQFFEMYEKLSKSPDFNAAQRQQMAAVQESEATYQARIETLKPHLDDLAVSLFDDPPDVFALKLTVLAKEMGLLHFTRDITESYPKTNADGLPISAREQMQRIGHIVVDHGEVQRLTEYLINNAGSPGFNTGVAILLPIIRRASAIKSARYVSGDEADQDISSFLHKDGSPKSDFVFSFRPGSDQYEKYKADPDKFWENSRSHWHRDSQGNISQDGGLELMLRRYVGSLSAAALDPEGATQEFIRRINKAGAAWHATVESYQNYDTEQLGYHAIESVAAGNTTLDDLSSVNIPKVMERVSKYADHVKTSLEAARTNAANIPLPEVIKRNMPNHGKTPFSWQVQSAHHAVVQGRAVMALDAGLGKTAAAAIYACMLLEQNKAKRVVFFHLKSMIEQFPEDVRNWVGPDMKFERLSTGEDGALAMTRDEILTSLAAMNQGLKSEPLVFASAALLKGTKDLQRRALAAGLCVYDEKANAYVRNKNIAKEEWRAKMRLLIKDDEIVKALRDMKDTAFVFDEAHDPSFGLRDPDNLGYMVAEEITNGRSHVLGLTGTPAANSVDDLYNLLSLIAPGQVTNQLQRFRNRVASLQRVPEYGPDGNQTGRFTTTLENNDLYSRVNQELQHVMFLRSLSEPAVQAEFRRAGMTVPRSNITRVVAPETDEMFQTYIQPILDGMDDYARLELAESRNSRRIKNYRQRLVDNVNPDYANESVYSDEDLWNLRYLHFARVVVDPNTGVASIPKDPVTGRSEVSEIHHVAYGEGTGPNARIQQFTYKPPRKDVPQRWDDVKDDPLRSRLYIGNMMRKALVHPELVWGSKFNKDHRYIAGAKFHTALKAIKNHFNEKHNQNRPVVVALENVMGFNLFREMAVEMGIPPNRIAEISGNGDQIVAEKRYAEDRDGIARAVNEGKISVLLLGIRAGGTGLNLQKVAKAILVQQPYTFYHAKQLINRFARIGQSDPVDVTILHSSNPMDFKAMERQRTRVLGTLPVIAHVDEGADEMMQNAARIDQTMKMLQFLGIKRPGDEANFDSDVDPEHPFGPQELQTYMEALGASGAPYDYSRFKQFSDQNFKRLRYQEVKAFERYTKLGFDKIKQKLEMLELRRSLGEKDTRFGMSEKQYTKLKRRYNRYLMHWYASAASLKDAPVAVPAEPHDVPSAAAGFTLTTAINPFETYVTEGLTDEGNLKMILGASVEDSPEAEPAHSTLPGAKDLYTNYYMFEAVVRNKVHSPEDMVDRVLRPLAESVGEWNPGNRRRLLIKVTRMMRGWANRGFITWHGTTPPYPKTRPDEEAVSPIVVPQQSAIPPVSDAEYMLRMIKRAPPERVAEYQKNPNLEIAMTRLGMWKPRSDYYALTPLGDGNVSKFDPQTIYVDNQEYELGSDQISQMWSVLRSALQAGHKIDSPEKFDLVLGGTGAPSPKTRQILASVLDHFERRGLVYGTLREYPPSYRATPSGLAHNSALPAFEVLDGTHTIDGEALLDLWSQVRSHMQGGGVVHSAQDIMPVLGLSGPTGEQLANELLQIFDRYNMIELANETPSIFAPTEEEEEENAETEAH